MNPQKSPRRCAWAKSELMIRYHDTEWGVPTQEDGKLYEMFLLEAFQAVGLVNDHETACMCYRQPSRQGGVYRCARSCCAG